MLVGSCEKKQVRSGLLGAYVPSSSDMSLLFFSLFLFLKAATKIEQ